MISIPKFIPAKAQKLEQTIKTLFDLIHNRLVFDQDYKGRFTPRELNEISRNGFATEFDHFLKETLTIYSRSMGYNFEFRYNKDQNPEGQKDGSTYTVETTWIPESEQEKAKLQFRAIIDNTVDAPKVFNKTGLVVQLSDTIIQLAYRNDGHTRITIKDMKELLAKHNYTLSTDAYNAYNSELQQATIDCVRRVENKSLSINSVPERGWLFDLV
jgi:hypothetical protein